jgi:hypothetical protein
VKKGNTARDAKQQAAPSTPSDAAEIQHPDDAVTFSEQLHQRRKGEFRQRMLGSNRRAINYQSRTLALSMIVFVFPAYALASHYKIGLYPDIILNFILFCLAFWFSAWRRNRAFPLRR